MAPEYFTARKILAAAFARRTEARVHIGQIVSPWEPAEISLTPEQYRALQTHDAPADETGAFGAMLKTQ